MYNVLDELTSPLTSHVSQLLSQPATGTDDAVTHGETKRAFLGLLNSIMASKLQGVFLSDRMFLLFCLLALIFTIT
jgi:exportin-T